MDGWILTLHIPPTNTKIFKHIITFVLLSSTQPQFADTLMSNIKKTWSQVEMSRVTLKHDYGMIYSNSMRLLFYI